MRWTVSVVMSRVLVAMVKSNFLPRSDDVTEAIIAMKASTIPMNPTDSPRSSQTL